MVEVAEDNKKKEKKGKKGEKKERRCKKGGEKVPTSRLDPRSTSYSAVHVTTIELCLRVYNCYRKSHYY